MCKVAAAVTTQKFRTLPALAEVLLSTGDALLAEMTCRDPRWGTGRDPSGGEDWLHAHRAPWPGTNIQGWALMVARAALLEDRTARAGRSSVSEALPTPYADQALATPVAMLAPALRLLADAIAPHEAIFDRGGGGACGPNSLAFVFWCLNRGEDDGFAFRTEVVAHTAGLLDSDAVFSRGGRAGEDLSVREYLVALILSWPVAARCGREATAEAWLELMALPTTWADEAFLTMAADLRGAEIEYRAVTSAGELSRGGVQRPRLSRQATCRVSLALWVQQHYAAIARTSEGAVSAPLVLRAGGDDWNLSAQGLDPRLAPLVCDPAAYDLETAASASAALAEEQQVPAALAASLRTIASPAAALAAEQ